jgi:mono/diheme cytochrome c family protein
MKLKVIGAISAIIILFIISCESDESIEFKRYYSGGISVYQAHCQNCHGANGEGLSALIPPLTDSVFLKKNKASLACFVKNGLTGEIIINGKTFDDTMPVNDISSMEIAQVLTYIGNSFGNKLNTIDIQQTESNLGNCK